MKQQITWNSIDVVTCVEAKAHMQTKTCHKDILTNYITIMSEFIHFSEKQIMIDEDCHRVQLLM